MSEFLVIYVTYPNEEEATSLCSSLLEQELIACANIYPVQSMYRWEGKINKEKEWISILKSTKKNWEALQATITELHSYDTPCITKWNAESNEKYRNWIIESTI